jgi:CRISPR type I-E-associated protein CasB/Cse2
VDRITQEILRLSESSPGAAAELRRLPPSNPSCPAFWRLTLTFLNPPDRPLSAADEPRWAVLFSCMAHTTGLHAPGRRAGAALAAVTSEARFTRLLRARDERLWDELRHIAHQLASSAEPFDWTDLVDLILSDGRERADSVRRRLARDFYQALHLAEKDAS